MAESLNPTSQASTLNGLAGGITWLDPWKKNEEIAEDLQVNRILIY